MNKIWVLGLVIVLLITSSAMGATLQGTVYDFSLTKAENAVIEINTEPLQRTVSEQGKYQFNLDPGSYLLTAKEISQGIVISKTQESVNITKEGVFTVDLILFPELIDEDFIIEEVEEPQEYDSGLFVKTDDPYFFVYRFFWVLVAIAIIWALNKKAKQAAAAPKHPAKKKEAPELSDDLTDILAILKKNGGRMTQKDLRKKVPLSEAKISLMLLELEKEGKIKKIKKGRGNIIILR